MRHARAPGAQLSVEKALMPLSARILGAPRCTLIALSPGDMLRARGWPTGHPHDREAGDMLLIVALEPVRVGIGCIVTTLDKHGLHGPREVALDWFTWDDTFELVR